MSRIYEMSRKVSSERNFPAPKGLEYLPFQKAGIEYLVKNANKGILIADPPGLGKTIQTIGYINQVQADNILVICPASLVYNWAKEIMRWHLGNPKIQVIRSSNDTLDRSADIHISSFSLSINQDVHKFLQRKKPELLVIDECHNLKNPIAKRTQAIYTSKANLADRAKRIFALSGTPIVNRPIEIYETCRKLCPKSINNMSYEQYVYRYCGGFWDGLKLFDQGATNLNELGRNLRNNFMLRRKKSQVLHDLPDKTVSVVTLEPSRHAKDLIRQMRKFDLQELKRAKKVEQTFEGISTMRRELGEEKVEPAIEYLTEVLNGGRQKIIVFAHHKEVIRKLHSALIRFKAVAISGKTPKGERQGIIDRFQNDPDCRVFIGSISACGVGITLTASDYVAFVECDWTPGLNDQAIDRAHRIGQKNAVLAEFLVFRNSLDDNMLRSQSEKAINIEEVMA